MSGPPPWTTIGLSPTYLSSTTSRANSSRSSGSVIAAPPYLMTTVLPWNSRMYGSASSSVPTSGIDAVMSGSVVGIDPHVLVGEVREEHLGLGARLAVVQADRVLDLMAGDRQRERLLVIRTHAAGLAHRHALDRDVELDRQVEQHAADRLRDPPPVGVAAMQRRLHERGVGDRARRALDRLAVAAAHEHAPDALRALAVSDDQQRELAQERVERLAEGQLVGRLGGDLHPARAARHQDRRVVRRELAVHGDAVE